MILRIFKDWLTERRLRKQAIKIFEAGKCTFNKKLLTNPRTPKEDQKWTVEKFYTLDFQYPQQEGTRRLNKIIDSYIVEVAPMITFCAALDKEWARYSRKWLKEPISLLKRCELETQLIEKIYKNLVFDETYYREDKLRTKQASSAKNDDIDFNKICAEVMREETNK